MTRGGETLHIDGVDFSIIPASNGMACIDPRPLHEISKGDIPESAPDLPYHIPRDLIYKQHIEHGDIRTPAAFLGIMLAIMSAVPGLSPYRAMQFAYLSDIKRFTAEGKRPSFHGALGGSCAHASNMAAGEHEDLYGISGSSAQSAINYIYYKSKCQT